MRTRFLNSIQVCGLKKLGDVVIPGDNELPKFSQTHLFLHADRMLKYINTDDRSGLQLLLFIFAFTPSFLIKFIIMLTELKDKVPTSFAIPLRMISTGLKGIIFTLYYAKLEDSNNLGDKIMETLDYKTSVKAPSGSIFSKEPSAHEIMLRARKVESNIRKLTIEERLIYIGRVKSIILEQRSHIVQAVQRETNKSKTDALVSEIFGVLDYLTFLEKETKNALKDQNVKTPIMLMGKKSKIYVEPLGTILIISPWNYPFFQAIVPIMTAFACGNACIYKPSEFTPLKGLVEKILVLSGFESDWVQIVYGDGKVGSELIDQRPDKIFFTGSVATGKKIMAQAAKQLIPVELELGGKDVSIVFEDANIERTTSGVIWGALTNLGQSCTSVEKVFVHEKIFEQFKNKLMEKVNSINQQVDKDGNADVGHMTTQMQVSIVAEHLEDALQKGAKLLTGANWDRRSLVIPPLLLENVTKEMKVYNQETFGPIIPIIAFHDEQEVIEKANDTDFGLSASVWSQDQSRCERVARALKVGNVSINNVMLTEGNPYLPFGGIKDSGMGRYKGVFGFATFCNIKSILIDKNSSKIEANWYPYTSKKYELFDQVTVNAFSSGLLSFIRFAISGMKLESLSQKIKR